MKMFLVSLIVMLAAISGMAVGVIFSNKKLKGSCGGLGKLMGDDCSFCDKKDECDKSSENKEDCLKIDETTNTVSLNIS
ncbi:hypothetical protein A9Q84_02285 [Halobacteriovorax marinus]|uniref:(Na+)-NQR maturation NqrM n=1 Tax=Halobacteriovorax marinus TaxID=97084 RepID=A0A1Y5FCN5_9BACT|nr:hypothetical protein A9Q84_02285 [Halobacteriovorax marinus]